MPIPTITPPSVVPLRSSAASNAAYVAAVETFLSELNPWSTDLNTFAADLVAATVGYYSATSSTSVAIGIGSKSFTVTTGKAYATGDYLLIADAAAPTTNWMWGKVTSYNSGNGALVFDSQAIGGSGTKTSWTINLSGAQGATGGSQLTNPNLVGTPVQDEFTMTDSVSVNIDPANGSVHHLTLTANRTLTHSLANGQFALLMVDDGTAYSITWTTIAPVWKTNGGAAPTLLTSGRTPILLARLSGTVYGWRLGDA